ncbi:FG-GAP repeat domain-containing protein [Streptomyces liangshanensis]|uniref:FG-GAP repeat domain-containing protein n=1 Tax=Streptomyces liangshanensis TaxID=2717324 RepID=UPI0036D84DC2
MGRHALERGGLTVAVSSLVVAVAAVTVASGGVEAAQGATAAGTTHITLADPSSLRPRADRPLSAGTTGFLHRQSGFEGLLWTDYERGTTVAVRNAAGVYTPGQGCTELDSDCRTAWYGADSDLVALPSALNSRTVTLWDPATRASSTVTSAYYYRALAGDTVVTERTLIDTVDGERRERPVTGDSFTISDNTVEAADASGVLVSTRTGLFSIDLASGVSTEAFADIPASAYSTRSVQSEKWVGWFDAETEPGASRLHLKPCGDLAAEEKVVGLPAYGSLVGTPVLLDDWLLLPTDTVTGGALTAVSLADGSSHTVLDSAGAYAIGAPGDHALVTGGTGPADWWVQRVGQGPDGMPESAKVRAVPATENAKAGIALSRGSLRVVEDDPGAVTNTTSVRTLTTNGGTTLTAGPAEAGRSVNGVCPYPGVSCTPLWGNSGSGPEDVFLVRFDDVDGDDASGLPNADRLVAIGDRSPGATLEFKTAGGAIVDVSDDYAVYNSGGAKPLQYVGQFGQGEQLRRTVRAAALNGSTLWSATTTAGTITSYSLTGKKTLSTVKMPGAGCVPTELQAAGRWVYWACGTASAGVYDTKAGTSVATTPGDVLLGDGFAVRHDHTTDELILTEAATGARRVLASGLAPLGTAGQKQAGAAAAVDRRHRWTVDEYTGLVAWFDAYEQTHVTTTGITPSAPATFQAAVDDLVWARSSDADSRTWNGTWLMSRPVTSWSVAFTSVGSGERGRATRTITGGATAAWLESSWNGKATNGSYFPNGRFTWTLKVTGLGTTGPATVATGTGSVFGGATARHDFNSVEGEPDGTGDVLTLSSSGGLTYQLGTGNGKFGDKLTGTGWPTTVKAVPFGDLSGDRCNDILVRLGSGALRLYRPGCTSALKPSTAYTTLGTSGWTQYDVLTSPGDISGDGLPDLIARNASTGAVYLYKGTSAGKLSARVRLYANWKTYKKIVGTGDLNGDGIGDLIIQDKSNNLYRYAGKGNGTFAAAVKVFTDWGGSYNTIVGPGDLNHDGKADLVSRDTAGVLWRNYGDGKGSFGARTKIATGWGGYKSLS